MHASLFFELYDLNHLQVILLPPRFPIPDREESRRTGCAERYFVLEGFRRNSFR